MFGFVGQWFPLCVRGARAELSHLYRDSRARTRELSDLSADDVQPLRVEPGEQRRLGTRQPHLAVVAQTLEQRGAAAWIEVSGDLVEQQDRRPARLRGNQPGVGEDQAEEERLLLAGRTAGGPAGPCRRG